MADTSDVNSGKPPKSRKNATNSELKQLEEHLQQLVGMLSMVVTFADEFDGIIIAERAPAVVTALINVARVNPQLRAALMSISVTGTYTALIASIVSLILPIIARHGYIPFYFAGPIPDDAMAAYQKIQARYFHGNGAKLD